MAEPDLGHLIDLQPLQEELPQLRFRPRIGQHPLGLLGDLLARR